jgi:hypothetical protein
MQKYFKEQDYYLAGTIPAAPVIILAQPETIRAEAETNPA